jgi:hypothetical protein
MKDSYPNYARLAVEVVKREAVKKTFEAEGIESLNE